MVLLGLLDVSVWSLTIWTLLSCHITLLAVTVFLHRAQAHRSVDLHPVLQHFFRFWLWLTTGMVTKEWVAVHRKHHARTEGPEDPHSPQIYGIKKVLLEGAELYREAASIQSDLEKYGKGTPDDWLERNVYSRFIFLGVGSLALIEFALFGLAGIAVFAIQMLCIPVLAAGVINGLGHFWGYRNFETTDSATNLTPIAAIICGEELHNNHHAYPSSARFSLRRWEFDLGWAYLRVFSWLKLAKIRRVAPQPIFRTGIEQMDMDTVKAIISSRLHVLDNYARSVMKPVHANALKSIDKSKRKPLKSIAGDLLKGQAMLDESARTRVAAAMAESDALKTVYEYQDKLQAIWRAAGANQETLKQALQEWCLQAEETGIECLQDFADRLRGYGLKPFAA
ncbi:UNVERIFIED_CONTAM: hypothetical protein GTU68_049037 [Idotea baltica]|nr:hypothetical protein [Idotea baltica]